MRSVTSSSSVGPPPLRARSIGRLRGAVDGDDVGAVDDRPAKAVRGRPLGQVRHAVLEVRRRGVGEAVVVEHEHDREAAHARQVHRLVRVAARRAAVAQPAERDARLACARGRRARSRPPPAASRGGARPSSACRGPTSPRWTLPSRPRVGPSLRPEVLGDDAPGRHSAHDVHAEVALGGAADVLRRHGPGRADRGRLVAATRVERAGDPALPVERVAALLDRSGSGASRDTSRAGPLRRGRPRRCGIITARALAHDRHDHTLAHAIHAMQCLRPARARGAVRMLRACWPS